MTLRLVLVSLVAGLGLGLPAWPAIEGCVGVTQKWLNARLAEMDVHREGARKYVVIHDLLADEMKRARSARPASPAPTPAPPVVTLADSAIGNDGPAELPASVPLPKLDDFLRSANAQTPSQVEQTSPAVVRPDELARLAWDRFGASGAELARTFASGLREAADRDGLDRPFIAMEDTEELYFDADFVLEVVPPTVATVVVVIATAPEQACLPGFEELEATTDLYFAPLAEDAAPAPVEALAATTEAADDEPALEAPPIEPAPEAAPAVASADDFAVLPEDVFAPFEAESAPAEARVEVALEAPPALEAAAAVVATTDAPASPAVAPEVNRAVRLTREALSAWVNVLTGPAVVTVSQRSAPAPR